MRNSKLRKNIFLSLLVAIGVGIGYVESMIPMPIALPGARLGLSNIVILTTIVVFGKKEGITVAILKSVLLMLVTGHVTSFFYSLAGSVFSSIAMSATYGLLKGTSLIGISLIGAFFHNLGQITVAILIVQNIGLLAYLPLLLLLGCFTGVFVGYSSRLLIGHMRTLGFNERIYDE